MQIETERLILREIDPERDFDGWSQARADEGTVRYLGVELDDALEIAERTEI